MFNFIERNKFSIIATLIVHVALYVWFNVQIIFKDYGPGERVVAVLDFSNEVEEDTEEVKEEDIVESDPSAATAITGGNAMNVTANMTQEKTTFTNTPTSFNKKSIDQQVWEELKAMESAEFSALGGTQKGATNNSTAGTKDKSTSSAKVNDKEINPNLVKTDAEKNENAGYGADVQAIASFSVPGRSPLKKAVPSYKCKVEGTVRVLIKVDQKGKVLTPEIDESKTNTQNICLREEALDYVRKWVFNQDFTGSLRVSGWIEFTYVAH
jgi:outer membrane biosynthesis protein TonB